MTLRPTAGRSDTQQERERAVSDLVAYTLMFSIIIVGVTLVSFGALDFLEETSDREQVENSERAMGATAATLDDIHRQADTQRSFNLPLGGGNVFFNESAIDVSSPDFPAFNRTYRINALEHRFDRSPEDVTVAYEAGGVFRSPGANAQYRPSIRCTENDVAVVSLVRLEGDNFDISEGYENPSVLNPRSFPTDAPLAEFGRTLIFSADVVRAQRNYTTTSGTLRVNVSGSANPAQWNSYFGRPGSDWTEAGTDTWECRNVDATLVRVTTIRLRLK